MIMVYGIKNCDSVKKALKFFDEHNIEFEFVDFKKQAPSKTQIQTWLKKVDWQILLNMRGTTWRKLPDNVKDGISKTKAIELMLENPSIIKRPVVEAGNTLLVGFDKEAYAAL